MKPEKVKALMDVFNEDTKLFNILTSHYPAKVFLMTGAIWGVEKKLITPDDLNVLMSILVIGDLESGSDQVTLNAEDLERFVEIAMKCFIKTFNTHEMRFRMMDMLVSNVTQDGDSAD